ncbi:protein eva-1 homolog C-like isoform X1 [Acipenser ruthenus]|uniref:protein eva-1 homolog C-like isoform X1 n=2 Tax=Acipenser ruthenus TaxID=7906 RepID=UPI001560BAC1|nr:protein eva-1 homolog C-like isoform X1 [Acipenser ruthenus]
MFAPDVSSSSLNYTLVLGITCLTVFSNFTKSSSDFSGYLSKVLRNYTGHACDGEYISVRCPHRTTISIQASFYGRMPSHQMCPPLYPHSNTKLFKEDTSCSTVTSLQKMQDECQDRRSCQLLVNSRLFGVDPCPSTSKYLTVWYKCRPNEYKSKVACEDDKLKLSCKQSMVIAIYSAIFGWSLKGSLECPYQNTGVPAVECQSGTALQIMTSWCHGKRSCSGYASSHAFGDPCYPGVRKYLSVIYTCVPKKLLEEAKPKLTKYHTLSHPQPPRSYDPNIIGDGALPDVSPIITTDAVPEEKKIGRVPGFYPMEEKSSLVPLDEKPRRMINSSMESKTISTEMALLSTILAAYSFILENPERAALYFVSGICIGLILMLCAVVVQISCRTDCKATPTKKPQKNEVSDSESDSSDSDWDTTSDLSARRHRRFERTLNMNVFTSAEELERAQRLEERERIIREIWMNGQPEIPGTRSLNRYY